MAYSNYGAMVWRDGELVNETGADVALFSDRFNGMGARAIYASLLDKYYNDEENSLIDLAENDVFHVVMGDGRIRIGIYKMTRIVVMQLNDDDKYEILADESIDYYKISDVFDVPSKYTIVNTDWNHNPYRELFTKEYLDEHRKNRKIAKAMCNTFGAKKKRVVKDHFRLYSKHPKINRRKRIKYKSLRPNRIPKGKVLLPDGMWFNKSIGGIDIWFGVDEAIRTDSWNGKTVSKNDYVYRFGVMLDGHVWTCRVGACYGNGWQNDNQWPERLYEAVKLDA